MKERARRAVYKARQRENRTVGAMQPVSDLTSVDLHSWKQTLSSPQTTKLVHKFHNELEDWRNALSVHQSAAMQIGEEWVKVWLDTCSPISFISKARWLLLKDRSQLLPVIPTTHYGGLNGPKLNIMGCSIMILKIDSLKIRVICAILEEQLPRNCDIILGNYDLSTNDLLLTVHPAQQQLWLSKSKVQHIIATQPLPSLEDPIINTVGVLVDADGVHHPDTEGIMLNNDDMILTHERTLDAPGIFIVELQRRHHTPLPEGLAMWVEAAVDVNLPLSLRLENILQEPSTTIMDGVSGIAFLEMRKVGHSRITLPQGFKLGKAVEILTPQEQQRINLDKLVDDHRDHKSPMKLDTLSRVAPLIGNPNPTEDTMDTPQMMLLKSSTTLLQCTKDAKRVLHKFYKLSIPERNELIRITAQKVSSAKAVQLPQDRTDPLVPPLPKLQDLSFTTAIPVPNLAEENNAKGDSHDGPELSARANDASMIGDPAGELSSLEFFVTLQGYLWQLENGELMNTNPNLHRTAVGKLLLYRQAGLMRINYNKVLPAIKGVQYQVQLKEGADNTPLDAGRRRYSEKETLEICRQVLQLVQAGILQPTRSPWSSALVLVKKPGGSIRMCVDLRGINKVTLHTASQLPLITDVLRESFNRHHKIFSTLDLSQAYHQLEVSEDSRKYLAFKLPRISASQCATLGFSPPFQVTWNRVPFGLTDAVTTFSNLVMSIFQPAGFAPYLDDLGLGATTASQMMEKIDTIFLLAAKHGLTFGAKLTLYRVEIPFLGHQISAKGVSILASRVTDLLHMATPTDVAGVRTWLGAVGWCQSYLGMDYASVVSPLTDLTKLDQPFVWGPAQQAAVDTIKKALTSSPVLQIFDPVLETAIVTDGSIRGVGAVLIQRNDNTWAAVAYLSKKLTPVQSRWGTTQFELFAIMIALERWRSYLLDRHFTVLTDHHALTYLTNPKLFDGRRLRRWQMLLSEFHIQVDYRPGSENGLPDLLSRLPTEGQQQTPWIPIANDEVELIAIISQLECNPSTHSTVASVMNLQSLEAICPIIPNGTPVLVAKQVWNTPYPWKAVVVEKVIKNSKGVDWYKVQCDADPNFPTWRRTHVLEAHHLTVVEGSLEPHLRDLDRMDIDPPIEEPSILTLPPPVNTPVITLPEPQEFQLGDLVQVKIGHTQLFRLSKDMLYPMGEVTAITNDRITVRLFLIDQPVITHLRHHILKLSDKISIQNAQATRTVNYDIGDVVSVVSVEKRAYIRQRLVDMKCLKSNYGDTLIGVVVGTGNGGNAYYVHFGSFENGVEQLNMSDLHLIRHSEVPRLTLLNKGQNGDGSINPSGVISHLNLLNQLTSTGTENIRQKFLREVKRELKQDPYLKPIREYLKHGRISPLWNKKDKVRIDDLRKKFSIEKGLLYHHSGRADSTQLCIPRVLERSAIFMAHNQYQHFDWHKTFQTLQYNFYFRGMAEQVRRFVGECKTCQVTRNKQYYHSRFGAEIAERLFQFSPGKHWAVDLKSIQADVRGNHYMLVMMDLCSRYVVTVPLLNKSKETVVEAIYLHLILRFGGAGYLELLADKGSEFTNDYAFHLLDLYRIKCHFIKERHSQENGMVERFMRTFTNHFSKAIVHKALDPKEWYLWLAQLTATYNGLYHPAIAHTPFYVLFGKTYHLNTALEFIAQKEITNTTSTAHQYAAKLAANHLTITKLLQERYLLSREHLELTRAFHNDIPHFEVGELVLLLLGDSNGGVLYKNRAHAGPFVIYRQDSSSTYIIKGGDGIEVAAHAFKLVAYTPTLADTLGIDSLSATAVGAAESRILQFSTAELNVSLPVY